MNPIFWLLLALFSFPEAKAGKIRICIPKKSNTEITDSANVKTLFGEAFREISALFLPSVSADEKVDFELNNDVIRAKGYVKNIGFENTVLNISICSQISILNPISLILNEIVIHGDEYYLNGTVADIFYIDGKGPLDIAIYGLQVDINNFFPTLPFGCFTLDIGVKLQEWTVTFGGIMGGDELLEPTINEIIGDMGPDMVDFLWTSEYDKIVPIIQSIIDKYINPHLGHVDIATLKEGNLNKFGSNNCKSYNIPIKN